jgi:CheY-like chemotaxis protein
MKERIDILLVEDTPSDVRLTQEALKRSDLQYEMEVVSDGVEAMEKLAKDKEEGKLPDLILLDLNMPRKNGHEVLEEIKNDPALKMIPVVLLTVSERDEDVMDALSLKMNYYLAKPVTSQRLTAIVKGIHELHFANDPATRSQSDDDIQIRMVLAGNPHTAGIALIKLAEDQNPKVRSRVAENPNLPASVLEKLVDDPDPDVRISVSENPNATEEILKKLAHDPSEDVRMGVSENPKVPAEILSILAEDENMFVSSTASKTLSQQKGSQ